MCLLCGISTIHLYMITLKCECVRGFKILCSEMQICEVTGR